MNRRVFRAELEAMKSDIPLYHDSGWDSETQSLIDWYNARRASLPQTPFVLSPGVTISDPNLFYHRLDMDISDGSKGARNRNRALTEDLENLRAFCERPKERKRTKRRKKMLGTASNPS